MRGSYAIGIPSSHRRHLDMGPYGKEGRLAVGDRCRQERAWYVIRVRGLVDPVWFGGFAIAQDSTGDSILSGEVVDQAAFYGVISRARDLGLTIMSVERQERP